MTDTVHTEILKPHVFLQPWLENYFILKPAEIPINNHPWTVMPDGSGYLIFHLYEHTSSLAVVGPRSVYTNVNRKGRLLTIVAQFKPGGLAPILPIPVSEISDLSIPIEDVWPKEAEELINALTIYAREKKYKACVHLLDQVFIKKVYTLDKINMLITRATHLLEGKSANHKIKDISDKLGITDRHLRDVFKRNVGLGPKRYEKIVRVNNIVKQVDNGYKDRWAKLALDAGYYDQSHLIEDFHQLLGENPEAFISRTNREEVM